MNSFVVEENLAFDPAEVNFFGTDGIVFEAQGIPDPVEQFSGSGVQGFLSI